ncbi:MAG: hypothetical protein JXR84_04840 [Anaerolineae bacterium]|nr:hypothetical protein [Anaerolineae bacterium]
MGLSRADSQQVLRELENMSPAMLEQVLTFARFLKHQKQADRAKVPSGHYDFSNLAGKLSWHGDAVATQRQLRDEW